MTQRLEEPKSSGSESSRPVMVERGTDTAVSVLLSVILLALLALMVMVTINMTNTREVLDQSRMESTQNPAQSGAAVTEPARDDDPMQAGTEASKDIASPDVPETKSVSEQASNPTPAPGSQNDAQNTNTVEDKGFKAMPENP